MKSVMKRIILLFSCLLILQGCYYDKGQQLYPSNANSTTCDTTSVSYSSVIKPILDQYCGVAGCHDAITVANGYDYTKYSGIQLSASHGRLIGSINQASGYLPMPQSATKIPQCDIDKMTAWVNAGYPNN